MIINQTYQAYFIQCKYFKNKNNVAKTNKKIIYNKFRII